MRQHQSPHHIIATSAAAVAKDAELCGQANTQQKLVVLVIVKSSGYSQLLFMRIGERVGGWDEDGG